MVAGNDSPAVEVEEAGPPGASARQPRQPFAADMWLDELFVEDAPVGGDDLVEDAHCRGRRAVGTAGTPPSRW